VRASAPIADFNVRQTRASSINPGANRVEPRDSRGKACRSGAPRSRWRAQTVPDGSRWRAPARPNPPGDLMNTVPISSEPAPAALSAADRAF
jgi:hypothetical protein